MGETDYFVKIVLMGSVRGKIALREKFCGRELLDDEQRTIGADFVSVDRSLDEKKVTWQIWDFAGQDSFKSIRERFFKGAMGGLALYDINSKESFKNCTAWIKELWTNSGRGVVPINIVGLGAERRDENSIPVEKGELYAEKLTEKIQTNKPFTVNHFEISVEKGTNIDEPFEDLGRQIIAGLEAGQLKLS